MGTLFRFIRKPLVFFLLILPCALLAELAVLVSTVGISLPSERGTATSSYEVRDSVRETHFITRNHKFDIVEHWDNEGKVSHAVALRQLITIDRQLGVEGDRASVKVEALDGKKTIWSFEEPGEKGEPLSRLYEVTKYGCCAAPNTYTYFSLSDGKKLRTTHIELTPKEFEALDLSIQD